MAEKKPTKWVQVDARTKVEVSIDQTDEEVIQRFQNRPGGSWQLGYFDFYGNDKYRSRIRAAIR